MTLIRNVAGVAALLLAGLVLMLASGSGSTASAQTSNPMQLYGVTGQGAIVAGDVVTAYIGGQVIGTSIATAGGWVIDVGSGTNGAVVTFKVNNRTATETVTYQGFSAVEITLTLPPLLPTPTPGGTGDGTMTAPTFGNTNIGSAVFNGGSIEQLAAAVSAAGGTAVWVQDNSGTFRVYSTTAPAFVNASFNTVFAAGFSGPTAVTVVK